MAVVDVGVVINARDNATATINRVRQAAQQLNGSNGLGGISRSAGGAGQGMGSLLSRFNTVAASAFILYQTVRTLGLGLLKFAGEAQRASLSMIITTGSFEQAQAQLVGLTNKFAPAGFAVENMVQNFNALRGAGLGLEQANKTLEATAAAVAAFGGSQQNLDRASLALTQISAKGVAQMEELRGQLSEAVPAALAIMADQADMSVAEFTANVKKGLVSSEEAIRLFTDGANELFGGVLEAQKNTLPGAVAALSASVGQGLADLFARTDLDERITVLVQNLTEAILNFFASIDQQKIDEFIGSFQPLINAVIGAAQVFLRLWETLEPVRELTFQLINFTANLALAMIQLGEAVFNYAVVGFAELLKLVVKLNPAMQGMQGYVQGSTKAFQDAGANALKESLNSLSTAFTPGGSAPSSMDPAAMERILESRKALEESARKLNELQLRQNQYLREQEKVSKEQERIQERIRDLLASTNAQYAGSNVQIIAALDRTANRMYDILGLEEQIFDVRQASAAVAAGMSVEAARAAEIHRGIASGMTADLATIRGNAVGTFLNGVLEFRKNILGSLTEIKSAQLDAFSELTGDKVQAAVLRVNIEYDRQRSQLESIQRELIDVNNRTAQEEGYLQNVNNLLQQNDILRAQAVEYARLSAEFAERQAIAEAKAATSKAFNDAFNLAGANNDGILSNIRSGTNGGKLMEDVRAQRFELQQAVADTAMQIDELTLKASTAQGELLDQINKQIGALSLLQGTQVDAMNRLSESAILARQLWQEVGSIIERSVGDALYGLITGTASLKDVGIQMFQSLTRAAIDYIVQLMIINALKAASGMPFGNGGIVGGGSTPVPGLASGGAVMGGIISGPTMFLAGEAGKEAILPLANVGGKLGVRAGGGGGDTYQINISAIDTRTGTEFILKNMDAISGGLRRRNQLNRGTDRSTP